MPRAIKPKPPKPCVIIDTREQTPWRFSAEVEVARGTLHTGDYSLAGHESAICIERKSLDDLVQTVTRGRERFERELERMRSFAFKAVLIEASLADLRDHRYTSQALPAAIFGSCCCLHVDYGVPFLWCHDRAIAARVCERVLRRFHENLGGRENDPAITDLPPPA